MKISSLKKYEMQLGLFFMMGLIIVLFIIGNPTTFLKGNIYAAFLSTVPFVGIMALGLTFVLVCGEIDLSFPAVMAFSAYVFSITYLGLGSVLLGIIAGIATGAVIGMVNGLFVTKIGIPSIIATLGMQFLIRGSVHVSSGGLSLPLRGIRGHPLYTVLIGEAGGVIPAQSIWFAIIAVVLWFILFRHKFGDHTIFTGDNENAARMLGINVDRTKIMVFMLMGSLSGFAGIIASFRLVAWWPTMGGGYLMTTMATVFVGGTSMFGGEGTILGTFIGAFIIGSLEAGIVAAGLSGFWTRLIYGVLILVAVTIHTFIRRRRA